MTTDLTSLRTRIARSEQTLADDKALLARRISECPHNRDGSVWSQPVEHVQNIRTTEDDPSRPVFAGVDIMTYEQREVTKTLRQWVRTCQLCGTTQSTSRTREVKTAVPDFK